MELTIPTRRKTHQKSLLIAKAAGATDLVFNTNTLNESPPHYVTYAYFVRFLKWQEENQTCHIL